jgi:hypothetical protein
VNGKIVGSAILAIAVLAGAALYYLQVYGFYRTVPDGTAAEIALVSAADGAAQPLAYSDFEAIDADSSPIRFRACFRTEARPAELAQRFTVMPDVVPRNAPYWFDCFDAAAIAAEIEAGTAQVFLGQKNVHYGVDRVVAVTEDGRGYVWHELNDCGEKAYDGTVVGEECPPREELR